MDVSATLPGLMGDISLLLPWYGRLEPGVDRHASTFIQREAYVFQAQFICVRTSANTHKQRVTVQLQRQSEKQ